MIDWLENFTGITFQHLMNIYLVSLVTQPLTAWVMFDGEAKEMLRPVIFLVTVVLVCAVYKWLGGTWR